MVAGEFAGLGVGHPPSGRGDGPLLRRQSAAGGIVASLFPKVVPEHLREDAETQRAYQELERIIAAKPPPPPPVPDEEFPEEGDAKQEESKMEVDPLEVGEMLSSINAPLREQGIDEAQAKRVLEMYSEASLAKRRKAVSTETAAKSAGKGSAGKGAAKGQS